VVIPEDAKTKGQRAQAALQDAITPLMSKTGIMAVSIVAMVDVDGATVSVRCMFNVDDESLERFREGMMRIMQGDTEHLDESALIVPATQRN
jgi:hypothetical protein